MKENTLFIIYPLIGKRLCAYQSLKNLSFSENFTYVLNGWSLPQHYLITWRLTFCNFLKSTGYGYLWEEIQLIRFRSWVSEVFPSHTFQNIRQTKWITLQKSRGVWNLTNMLNLNHKRLLVIPLTTSKPILTHWRSCRLTELMSATLLIVGIMFGLPLL